MEMKCIFNIGKNISILLKVTQVSNVAHGPLVFLKARLSSYNIYVEKERGIVHGDFSSATTPSDGNGGRFKNFDEGGGVQKRRTHSQI
jgi:hypothetical protein